MCTIIRYINSDKSTAYDIIERCDGCYKDELVTLAEYVYEEFGDEYEHYNGINYFVVPKACVKYCKAGCGGYNATILAIVEDAC